MILPERFSNLPPYAFPRLRALLDAHAPGGEVVHMSIGEPTHAPPPFVAGVLAASLDGFGRYPANDGNADLLTAIADWIGWRYGAKLDPATQILALNGTREGLFAAALALCPEAKAGQRPAILMPNPFYQVYAVGTAAVAAKPHFVPATAETGHLPDFASLPKKVLDRTALAYVCSPANPQGAVADRGYWDRLFDLAERHDFRVMADECYSEIYRDTAPCGALEALAARGGDPERLVIFHSLSKRSSLPGLRSGFAAGGAGAIAAMKQLRNYAGAPLPEPLQQVAARCWQDEDHVARSRARYVAKYEIADRAFRGLNGYVPPQAGFFLWLPVEDGEAAALKLWRETGVRVLPGAYLSREVGGVNPGRGFIRVALVADEARIESGLGAIRACLYR